MHKHLPNSSENLAPAPLSIPNVPFFVKIVMASVRHQMVVTSMKEALMHPPKEIAMAVDFGTAGHVGRNRLAPLCHHLLERKSPFSVKDRVKPCSPPFRET